MLKIVKLSDVPNEVEIVKQEEPDKFKCYKCHCTDINKLYLLHIDRPTEDGKAEYIADCYCNDCCPFDMLTKFANTYYLYDECKLEVAQMAQLMQMAGISKAEINRKLLGL